jgi:hypothetical protein
VSVRWLVRLVVASVLLIPGSALAASWSLIVADGGEFGTLHGGLIRVNPFSGAQSTITHTGPGDLLVEPVGGAVGRDGSIYVSDIEAFGGQGGIIRVDPVTGAQTAIARSDQPGSLVYDPGGIALAPDGSLLVVDFRGPGGSGALGPYGGVLRIDPRTRAQTAVSRSDGAGNLFVNPTAVASESATSILVTDFSAFGGPGGVIRVDPDTGAQTAVTPTVTSGSTLFSTGARGIALPGGFSVLALNQASPAAVVGINEVTGAQELVTHDGLLTGAAGLALEPGGQLVVANNGSRDPAVIRVDLIGGTQRIVAQGSSPGGLLSDPLGIVSAPLRPVITAFSISHHRFRVGRTATPVIAKAPPRGATLTYRLSEPSLVRVVIEQIGRRHRIVKRTTLQRTGKAGHNSIRFSGRIGTHKLAAGRYTALIGATVAYAPPAAARAVNFTIVR